MRLIGRKEVLVGSGWECRDGGHWLTTDRLILRPLTSNDEQGLLSVLSDPEVVYWQGYHAEPEELQAMTRRWVEFATSEAGRHIQEFAICDRSTGEVIGSRSVRPVTFRQRKGKPLVSCEVGGSIKAGWRERGLGKVELRATLRLIEEHLGYTNVIAATEVANARAIGQYESAGFGRLGTGKHTLPNGREVLGVVLLRTEPARRTCPVEPVKA